MMIAMQMVRHGAVVGFGLGLALMVSGCSMTAFKPATGSATAALASLAAPATPAGHVPRAEDVPRAPVALGYAEGSLDGLITHYA